MMGVDEVVVHVYEINIVIELDNVKKIQFVMVFYGNLLLKFVMEDRVDLDLFVCDVLCVCVHQRHVKHNE
jgi:hypothetical protein